MTTKAKSNIVAMCWLIAVMVFTAPIFAASLTADDVVPDAGKIIAFGTLTDMHANTVIVIVAMLIGFLTSASSNHATVVQARERTKESVILSNTIRESLEKIEDMLNQNGGAK